MSMSNSMVAHNWAHGAAGKGSNFRTDGKELISYSTMVAYNTGRGLVFISADSMGTSTGKQLSYARSACSHLDVVYTPMFTYGSRLYNFDEKQAFNLACKALSITLEGYSKARLGKYLHGSIVRTAEDGARLVHWARKYGFSEPVFSFPEAKLKAARVYAEQYEVKQAARNEEKRRKEYARQIAQREKDAYNFQVWREGHAVPCPASYRLDANGGYYTAVRDNKVITSGGAECPIEHARAAVAFWGMKRHTGVEPACVFEPWHRNGQRVQLGTFQLDRIDEKGNAFAGCHKFSAEELNRLYHLII